MGRKQVEATIERVAAALNEQLETLSKMQCPTCEMRSLVLADSHVHSGVVIACNGLSADTEDGECSYRRVFTRLRASDLPSPDAKSIDATT